MTLVRNVAASVVGLLPIEPNCSKAFGHSRGILHGDEHPALGVNVGTIQRQEICHAFDRNRVRCLDAQYAGTG